MGKENQGILQGLQQGDLGEVTVSIKRQSIIDLSTGITIAGVIIILFYFSFKRATNS
jgi:hypothetical protein